MTPFDPIALLVMLQTFYPAVSVAALQQARRDRPEYFAGGVLFGSQGEKFRLPDGRGFDLIFDVDGPGRRWHVLFVPAGAGGAGGEAAFPLEPGPLTPIDLAAWPTRGRDDVFLPLVAAALRELGATDAHLLTAETTIAEASLSADFDAAAGEALDPAEGRLGGLAWLLDGIDPADIIRASDANAGLIDPREADYDETLYGDFPGVPPLGPIPPSPPDIPVDIPDFDMRLSALEEAAAPTLERRPRLGLEEV